MLSTFTDFGPHNSSYSLPRSTWHIFQVVPTYKRIWTEEFVLLFPSMIRPVQVEHSRIQLRKKTRTKAEESNFFDSSANDVLDWAGLSSF